MRLNSSLSAMLLVGVAAATFSCGDDDSSTPGAGGKNSSLGGSSGSSSIAGKSGGGTKSDGGTPPDGQGGMSEGGAGAGNGGEPVTHMAGQGGDGGEGGQAPIGSCGNGTLDAAERCDDGNLAADDGCSARCTVEACDACTLDAFPAMRLTEFLPVDDCSILTWEPAKKACQDVVDCIATSQCGATDKNIPPYRSSLSCLCGALDYEACSKAESTADLTGTCKNQIRAAANGMADGTKSPAFILSQLHTRGEALGQALRQVDDPGVLPSIGCETLTKGADRKQCDAVVACLYESKCAANSTRDGAECYCGETDNDTCFSTITDPNDARLKGACKSVIQAAAGGAQVVPLQVAQIYYDTLTPVGAAIQLGNGLRDNCKEECFGSTP